MSLSDVETPQARGHDSPRGAHTPVGGARTPLGEDRRRPSPRRSKRVVGRGQASAASWRSRRSSTSVAGQDLGDAGVRLAAFADYVNELPVLELDAVHRDVDGGHVYRLVVAGEQIVVAGDVRAGVADVAEERPERPLVVERQRQRADGEASAFSSWIDMSITMPRTGWIGPWRTLASTTMPPVWYWNRSTVCAAWCRSRWSVQLRGSPRALVFVRRKKYVSHLQLLDRQLAGLDPPVDPLVAGVEPAGVTAHRREARATGRRRPPPLGEGVAQRDLHLTCLPASRRRSSAGVDLVSVRRSPRRHRHGAEGVVELRHPPDRCRIPRPPHGSG